MPKLPLKMSVLKTVIELSPATEQVIFAALEPVYGRDRQFSPRAVEQRLLALRAVGLITETFPTDASGELSPAFIPTRAGKIKMSKYIS
ncbi:MAG: hypothetical protein WCX65_04300 [bacterium]